MFRFSQYGFPRHQRKISPFEIPAHPGPDADYSALEAWSRQKAVNHNQHVIGYGALAEAEWGGAGLPEPDLSAMRRYRIERIRTECRQRDLAGVYLYDPLNIRYATDTTNMQLWTTHNPVRSCFIAADGPVILYDFHNCEHLSDYSEVVDEVHPGIAWFYMEAGVRVQELAQKWAKATADLVHQYGAGQKRLAFDQIDPHGIGFLQEQGVEVVYGEDLMEEARKIKSKDELTCMRRAIVACEAAMKIMEDNLQADMTENDLWAILHAENIRRGGEWIETRLLSSGPRTNPWFQESSARVIENGDLVAFDTDLIGPYGFCVDISRTWLCGEGAPTKLQCQLYQMAVEQIQANIEILAPGLSFRELTHQAKGLDAGYLPNRYGVLYHGVGLCDEYPSIRYPVDWESHGYDGALEAGMVVCVESYVGRHGGHEGVKLEEQVLITEDGYEVMSHYPFDKRLSG